MVAEGVVSDMAVDGALCSHTIPIKSTGHIHEVKSYMNSGSLAIHDPPFKHGLKLHCSREGGEMYG